MYLVEEYYQVYSTQIAGSRQAQLSRKASTWKHPGSFPDKGNGISCLQIVRRNLQQNFRFMSYDSSVKIPLPVLRQESGNGGRSID